MHVKYPGMFDLRVGALESGDSDFCLICMSDKYPSLVCQCASSFSCYSNAIVILDNISYNPRGRRDKENANIYQQRSSVQFVSLCLSHWENIKEFPLKPMAPSTELVYGITNTVAGYPELTNCTSYNA